MSKGLRIGLIVVGVSVAAAALLLVGVGLAGAYWGVAGGWPAMMTNGFLGGSFGQAGRFGVMGPGMMQGYGSGAFTGGMMGGSRGGYGTGGMMGSGGMMGYAVPGTSGLSNVEPLSLEEAEAAVQDYLASLGDDNLTLGEIMIFDNHAYAQIVETTTGIGAMEVLVDPVTLAVYPEHGPNMMWNLKYSPMAGMGFRGAMGGMMGGTRGRSAYRSAGNFFGTAEPTADMPVTAEEAIETAQAYLDRELPGTEVDKHADPFYGYYTLDILRDGEPVGMLSVNGTSGEVFLHTWHGDFVEMAEAHGE